MLMVRLALCKPFTEPHQHASEADLQQKTVCPSGMKGVKDVPIPPTRLKDKQFSFVCYSDPAIGPPPVRGPCSGSLLTLKRLGSRISVANQPGQFIANGNAPLKLLPAHKAFKLIDLIGNILFDLHQSA